MKQPQHHWLRREPKDRYMRHVLSSNTIATLGMGIAQRYVLSCGHTAYGTVLRSISGHGADHYRCPVCLRRDLDQAAGKRRRSTPAEQIITDYLTGQTSSVIDAARRAIHTHARPSEQAQPAVAQNTGIPRSEYSSGLAPAEARDVATQPGERKARRGNDLTVF